MSHSDILGGLVYSPTQILYPKTRAIMNQQYKRIRDNLLFVLTGPNTIEYIGDPSKEVPGTMYWIQEEIRPTRDDKGRVIRYDSDPLYFSKPLDKTKYNEENPFITEWFELLKEQN